MLVLKPITADQTLALRQRVLWPGKPLEFVRVPKDDTALHLGAFDRDKLVGVASFYPIEDTAQLRKLAVDPAFQGQGIGAKLVLAGAESLRKTDLKTMWCDARVTAIGFYERLGFCIEPRTFDKSGVLYRKAILTL